MFNEIIACVASSTKLVRLDEYAMMGFPGYTLDSEIHIVLFLFEPADSDDCEYYLEGAFFHLRDNKPLHSGLRVISMPAHCYFSGLADERLPTVEDVSELNNLPLEYHNDGEWMANIFSNPNRVRPEKFECFATVNSSSGPMLYKEYAELGFPGMAWNTGIKLFQSPYKLLPNHLAQSDMLILAKRFLDGEDTPEGFVVIPAFAYQDFDDTTARWQALNHKKNIPNLQVPTSNLKIWKYM